MKKKLSVVGLCLLGFAYSFASQAATLQDLSAEDLNQQIQGLAGSDQIVLVASPEAMMQALSSVSLLPSKSQQVATTNYRSSGCSSGCSVGCSSGCSVGCSVGCSSGCSSGCGW